MYHLAQLNVANALAPLDSPQMAEFVEGLDPVNAIAEASDGFVWRLKDDSGNATNLQYDAAPDLLINMSVWKDVDSLKQFMFKTHHADYLKQKRKWFIADQRPTYVLWWIPAGHVPTIEEAMDKLNVLRKLGPSETAFSFAKTFAPPTIRSGEISD